MNVLLLLFLTFLKIGAVSFGGGYGMIPLITEECVRNNWLTEEEVIKYASSIQSSGAIDSHVKPYPSPMPGYEHKIIMASPSFTQGSSIELSCDGPLKKPYVLFQQGSLTYEYGKLSITNAIKSLNE